MMRQSQGMCRRSAQRRRTYIPDLILIMIAMVLLILTGLMSPNLGGRSIDRSGSVAHAGHGAAFTDP